MNDSKYYMYYAAIVCHADVNEKVLPFKYWMKEQFGCVAALKSPAHITLIPPFWLDKQRETDLLHTLQSFSADNDQLEIDLQGFSHFNKRVLFINIKTNPLLEKIKRQTEKHFLQAFGDSIKADERPFHPHVTIANRDMKPPDFIKAWEYFSTKNFKETFHTKTISLLKLVSDKWNVIGEKEWS